MNKQRVLQALEFVKSNPYGKWGILNIEQRRFIKELCNSWLILDEATNMQTKEIERLKELSKVDSQQGQEIIIELKQEIERLQNTIKEVREYIEKWLFEAGGNGACMNYDDIEDIREILKKENK